MYLQHPLVSMKRNTVSNYKRVKNLMNKSSKELRVKKKMNIIKLQRKRLKAHNH